MKEFSIPMLADYQRPVVKLYNLPTLIDTGSLVPVFSMYPEIFQKYFDSKLIMENRVIGGFGGNEAGAVYSIKNFKIGELNFNNFEVFVPIEPKIKFPFLLSATLFHGMNYEVDNLNSRFVVRMKDEQKLEREFKIRELRGMLYPQIDGNLITDVRSFLYGGGVIF